MVQDKSFLTWLKRFGCYLKAKKTISQVIGSQVSIFYYDQPYNFNFIKLSPHCEAQSYTPLPKSRSMSFSYNAKEEPSGV